MSAIAFLFWDVLILSQQHQISRVSFPRIPAEFLATVLPLSFLPPSGRRPSSPMPLPFAVKAVFCALSLSGWISSAIVLKAFSMVIQCTWAPLLYFLGSTFLHLPFSLGMVWLMDPTRFPIAFCYAQALTMSTGAFFIAGIATSWSIGTYRYVIRPREWNDDLSSVLKWRKIYAIPVLVVPALCSAVHILVIFTLDSVRQYDGMGCDVNHPLWLRFFGYAGMTLLIALPGLLFSVMAVVRVRKIQSHINRSRAPDSSSQTGRPSQCFFGVRAKAVRKKSAKRAITIHDDFESSSTMASEVSEGFPTFANPPPDDPPHIVALGGSMDFELSAQTLATIAPEQNPTHPADSGVEVDERVSKTPDSMWIIEDEANRSSTTCRGKSDGQTDEENPDPRISSDRAHIRPNPPWNCKHCVFSLTLTHITQGTSSKEARKPPLPSLASAVWQIMCFQILIVFEAVLISISTIVDVAKQKDPPSAFGTQQIGLILEGWGPFLLFVAVPEIRTQVKIILLRALWWRP
ncbi:hypothetical protein DL96DRAFT_942522 [Flagelloscypha sp. PMI_526]|nr:hypothetical protein DL96DRAFT_942522 [Flagelloscypha sp. PMI_526]